MTETAAKETLGFETEVKQLLHLMIHSLYSNKEIFLRELISNASDASDKLRFLALSDSTLAADPDSLTIRVDFDAATRTLSVTDSGIGMTRDEVVAQLGTIARSGTADFIESLGQGDRDATQLIGQFGVGFYSSFMVAEQVDVETLRAGQPPEEAVRWSSKGEGEYTLENMHRETAGTTVRLHLREDAVEYVDHYRLRSLIQRYSDHIAFPVELRGSEAEGEFEVVNKAKALWTRSRGEIEDGEYIEFYKYLSHDTNPPVKWSHNRVEGKREYVSLVYLPKQAPFDLWNRDSARGLKLYVQRVFIMDGAEQFLPAYLRFVKGVVDSNDLPLNVSREILQQDGEVAGMRQGITRRVLGMLAELAEKDEEAYAEFWSTFGAVLKEGLVEDHGNSERIMPLLRMHSSQSEPDAPTLSLADYVAASDAEDPIYYLVADSLTVARSSPHLEWYRSEGKDVLLFTDPVDAWVVQHLHEYEGRSFQDIARDDRPDEDSAEQKADERDDQDLTARVQRILAEEVESVRVSSRLTDSPARLVAPTTDLNPQMRKILEAAGQAVPASKPILELNPAHDLVARLGDAHEQTFEDLARVLYEQALLIEGRPLLDPGTFVQRVNRLLQG